MRAYDLKLTELAKVLMWIFLLTKCIKIHSQQSRVNVEKISEEEDLSWCLEARKKKYLNC